MDACAFLVKQRAHDRHDRRHSWRVLIVYSPVQFVPCALLIFLHRRHTFVMRPSAISGAYVNGMLFVNGFVYRMDLAVSCCYQVLTAGSKEGCEDYPPHFTHCQLIIDSESFTCYYMFGSSCTLDPSSGCVLIKKDKNNIIALIGG